MPVSVSRTDYAANGGGIYTDPNTGGAAWPSIGYAQSGPSKTTYVDNPPGLMTATARTEFTHVAEVATGIVYTGSLIKMADITDGTSNTYLVGEKYLDTDDYATGEAAGDNEAALVGDDDDLSRWADPDNPGYTVPMQDTPGLVDGFPSQRYGSAHANGFQMAFCDGSVHMMNYSINQMTHHYLADRKDGTPIDAKSF
jgi:prepilin-type processing-associated H-X9-DG protein